MRWHLNTQDRDQQATLISQLANGHLAGALGPIDTQTSGPGFGIVTPIYLAAKHVTDAAHAFDIAALSCLLVYAVAWLAASRAAGIPRRSAAELVGLLAGTAGVPILASYLESFHPADVLALAAALGGFAAVVRNRIWWAAGLLGFGLCTRQWVVVIVAVLAVLLEGRDRVRLALGSIGVFLVLIAPFAIANPTLTLDALVAKGMIRGGTTAAGLLPLPEVGTYFASRYAPLLGTLAACWWLDRRKARFTPEIGLTALVLVSSIRPITDPAGFVYYAAPGYAFLVLLVAQSWRASTGVAAAGVVLHVRSWTRHRRFDHSSADLHPADICWSLLATAIYVAPLVYAVARLRDLVPAPGPGHVGDTGGPDGLSPGVPGRSGSGTATEGAG